MRHVVADAFERRTRVGLGVDKAHPHRAESIVLLP
jgi:hypothetical protein